MPSRLWALTTRRFRVEDRQLGRNYLIGRVLTALSSHAFTPIGSLGGEGSLLTDVRFARLFQRFHCNAGLDTVNPSNAYVDGCINGTQIYMQQHATVMGGAGIAVACLMVRSSLHFYRSPLLLNLKGVSPLENRARTAADFATELILQLAISLLPPPHSAAEDLLEFKKRKMEERLRYSINDSLEKVNKSLSYWLLSFDYSSNLTFVLFVVQTRYIYYTERKKKNGINLTKIIFISYYFLVIFGPNHVFRLF